MKHTKQEYIDFFTHMEHEEICDGPLDGQAWDEIDWWLHYAVDVDKVFTKNEGHADRTNEWRIKHMTTDELSEFFEDAYYGSNKLRKKTGWKKWLNRKSSLPIKEELLNMTE